MKKNLTPAERLIVAADFKPEECGGMRGAYEKFTSLVKSLEGTEVIIKMNSILRAYGYSLISLVHQNGLRVFADLKLIDIENTLETDGQFLAEFKPELLTVMCLAGEGGMRVLMNTLPKTEVLGVTVLTSFQNSDCDAMFSCSTEEATLRLAKIAEDVPINGLVCSPAEVEMLRNNLKLMMSFNTPGIRPSWTIVPGDDQNRDRIMTPYKAIKAGADRIVVGRPITQSVDPYSAVSRTIGEIEEALA